MKKIAATALALIALSVPALAAGQSQPADPTQQALAQMVGECQNREAAALVQAYALQAQLKAEKQRTAEVEAQLAAEKRRADEAEAKLKGPDQPASDPAK